MARPADVALGLAVHYGHRLERPVVYTQGVALSGRLRLHELLPEMKQDRIALLVETLVSRRLLRPFHVSGTMYWHRA